MKEGDVVKTDQVLADMETDKAIIEMPSPVAGTVLKLAFKEGDTVNVGDILVVIGKPGESVPLAKPAPKAALQPPRQTGQAAIAAASGPQLLAPPPPQLHQEPGVLATPATRKLARELNIDLGKVAGTGPGGRITEEDVRRAAGGGVGPAPTAQPAPAPIITSSEGDITIPLTGLRKTIADRMAYSKTHIPHACGMDYVDVTNLVALREKEKRQFEPSGVKLTYLPFVVKACVIALKKYPSFNAHFNAEKNEVVAKKAVNIGIAVDTPDGLIVPVVKKADAKSIIDIANDIEALAMLARGRKLKLDEVRGGTFTITNVGSVGAMFSTPIINPPEVAILGIHRIRDMPMVVEGMIQARKVMGVSLCFDHRVVDGALATLFMNEVKLHLEDPGLMLVEMI